MVKQNAVRNVREALLFGGLTLGFLYFVFWGPLAIFGIPAISFMREVRGPTWVLLLFMAGGFVPSAAALALTAPRERRSCLTALLRRAIQFRLGLRWYLAILAVVLEAASPDPAGGAANHAELGASQSELHSAAQSEPKQGRSRDLGSAE